jgi:type I restriction enzyme R subunit
MCYTVSGRIRRPPRLKRPQCGDPYQERLEESETLQQQAQNNSLAQFSASPDLQNEFVGAAIGAMDSHTDLSTQILNNSEISQKLMGELVPIIYKTLQTAG